MLTESVMESLWYHGFYRNMHPYFLSIMYFYKHNGFGKDNSSKLHLEMCARSAYLVPIFPFIFQRQEKANQVLQNRRKRLSPSNTKDIRKVGHHMVFIYIS